MSQAASLTRAVERSTAVDSRRWLVLATVVAAQFMFVVDAFIVNVAIPTMRADLGASAAEIQAVIAVYLIAYGTLVVTGGRLGDIHGAKPAFLAGLLGFTAASLWCGLAQSAAELIAARLVQGATAALMVPQVLATAHVLFAGAERGRAFGIYGIVLGLGGTVGFLLGGFLVTVDLAGLGWRLVFFVNGPVGVAIAVAAWRLMPVLPPRAGARLDLAGATTLFAGLLGVIAPLLLGRELDWAPWLWPAMAAGLVSLAGFLRLERVVAARGGLPLVDLALLADRRLRLGLAATFCFFLGNLSFYFVLTLYLQHGLGLTPWRAALAVTPLGLAFVVAARRGANAAASRGARALIEGCAVQFAGLVGLALLAAEVERPGLALLMLPLAVFGWGQGLVMAPLPSVVLARVPAASAGAGSGLYNTVTQIGNAAGVAVVGALFFAVAAGAADRVALLAALAGLGVALAVCAVLLTRLRRA